MIHSSNRFMAAFTCNNKMIMVTFEPTLEKPQIHYACGTLITFYGAIMASSGHFR